MFPASTIKLLAHTSKRQHHARAVGIVAVTSAGAFPTMVGMSVNFQAYAIAVSHHGRSGAGKSARRRLSSCSLAHFAPPLLVPAVPLVCLSRSEYIGVTAAALSTSLPCHNLFVSDMQGRRSAFAIRLPTSCAARLVRFGPARPGMIQDVTGKQKK